jgi:hypothetical protein
MKKRGHGEAIPDTRIPERFQRVLQFVADCPDQLAARRTARVHPPTLRLANPMLTHHIWLTSNARLARLYRESGQEPKARVIEERLLKLLAVADTDHPLLKELRARH